MLCSFDGGGLFFVLTRVKNMIGLYKILVSTLPRDHF
jgi:hypothetical protein